MSYLCLCLSISSHHVCSKSTALSVDDQEEYKRLVKKLGEQALNAVHIVIKMVDVQAKCPKRVCLSFVSDTSVILIVALVQHGWWFR